MSARIASTRDLPHDRLELLRLRLVGRAGEGGVNEAILGVERSIGAVAVEGCLALLHPARRPGRSSSSSTPQSLSIALCSPQTGSYATDTDRLRDPYHRLRRNSKTQQNMDELQRQPPVRPTNRSAKASCGQPEQRRNKISPSRRETRQTAARTKTTLQRVEAGTHPAALRKST